MILRIVVDNSLTDNSAEIAKETLARVQEIVKTGGTGTEAAKLVGEVAGPAYTLSPVESPERKPDVLYVSPGVKRQFYPDSTEIKIGR